MARKKGRAAYPVISQESIRLLPLFGGSHAHHNHSIVVLASSLRPTNDAHLLDGEINRLYTSVKRSDSMRLIFVIRDIELSLDKTRTTKRMGQENDQADEAIVRSTHSPSAAAKI